MVEHLAKDFCVENSFSFSEANLMWDGNVSISVFGGIWDDDLDEEIEKPDEFLKYWGKMPVSTIYLKATTSKDGQNKLVVDFIKFLQKKLDKSCFEYGFLYFDEEIQKLKAKERTIFFKGDKNHKIY